MKWTLQQLMKIQTFPYPFETIIDFSNMNINRDDILNIGEVSVKGVLERVDFNTYRIKASVEAVVDIACALTLEPVHYNMNIEVDEVHGTNKAEETIEVTNNTISLDEIVWSNIIVNIPIRVVRDDAYEILKKRNIVLNEDIAENDNENEVF